MNEWANISQRRADEIKRRRHVAADLRLIAELIDDGLPVPLGIHNWRDGLRLSIGADDVPDWLLRLGITETNWSHRDGQDGEFLEVSTTFHGTPVTLGAYRRAVAEVTC